MVSVREFESRPPSGLIAHDPLGGEVLPNDRDLWSGLLLIGLVLAAMILPISGLRADLAEIAENLIRNELTPLERGEQLARRKEIHEAIYPETASTRIRGGPGRGREKTNADSALVSIAEDTAAKTGTSIRSVQSDVQIAKNIAEPVKEMIRGAPAAEDKSALLRIAQEPPSEQPSAARRALRKTEKPEQKKRFVEPHPAPITPIWRPGVRHTRILR
jgi:hypothetical protein